MAGKVYKEEPLFNGKRIIDSEYLAKKYLDGANLLAEAIQKIKEAKRNFEFARDRAGDNGDPAFESDEVLIKLAICVSSALSYYKEYMEEIKHPEKDDKD